MNTETSAPKFILGLSQCVSESESFLTIGCLARGFSPADSLTFKWKDSDGKELRKFVEYPAFGQDGDYTKISHLRVEKTNWDSTKPYKCEASNSGGTKEAFINATPPKNLSATVFLTTPSQMDVDTGTATFTCLAQKFSPQTHSFTWYHDDEQVTDSTDSFSKKQRDGSVTTYSATSILQINAEKWHPISKVKCVFQHITGSVEKEIEHAVPEYSSIDVKIDPPSTEDMLVNKTGYLTCVASGQNPGFKAIEMRMNGGLVANETMSEIKQKTLIKVELKVAVSYEDWIASKFTCSIEHLNETTPMEAMFNRENGKVLKRPTVYLLAPPERESLTLTCFVKDFYPKEVFVSWLADDEPVQSQPRTSEPIKNQDYYSIFSQITVRDEKWKIGTVYTCVVYHETIDGKLHTLTRSISDRMESTGVINVNMNTPGCCKQ